MKVLIDTNIILDFLQQREPFREDAEAIFAAIGNGQIIGYVTATTVTDIFYIVRKQTKSIEQARLAVIETLKVMQISSVNGPKLEAALASNLKDFEDGVQLACAVADNLDAIITRNAKDFSGSSMPILSVRELLNNIQNDK
ncbi:MAG: PIN domain-containing protein [Gomphosphaeria aponina SAG 52.96 = DSM 107014]|uniref:PIN domain-containing protein n=1 Tax=Gomphosphaeria aponina SAG 52.96 = DSM 107014 TaxID=1521640 RepID=A0A941GRB8_9CHRO|nr:PIN domain-containing protein [Gomphosphaeria aponina SAG 52.96 = DSM 107014]